MFVRKPNFFLKKVLIFKLEYSKVIQLYTCIHAYTHTHSFSGFFSLQIITSY